ncbi:MAG TPA: hypothetical protein VEV82_11035 [Actinomycetota bacterium]|nr:hypothetical protein [Actinomycetota bacterium]
MQHSRGLAPIVGAGMAVVAAGSLVLFSVLARQAALTPGPGRAVVPRAAPPASDQPVINVPHPSNKIVLPSDSDNLGPESREENAVAQVPPQEPAPEPGPDHAPGDSLIASVDVDLPVGGDGGENGSFHFPRPKIRFGRNLDPPGDDDDDDDDDDDTHDTDTDGSDDDANEGTDTGTDGSHDAGDADDDDTGGTDDEGLPPDDPTADRPVEQPNEEPEPGDDPVVEEEPEPGDDPVVGEEPEPADDPVVEEEPEPEPADDPVVGEEPEPGDDPVVEEEPEPGGDPGADEEVESVDDETGGLDGQVVDEPGEDFEGSEVED